jgi:hypothetical protein
MYRAMGSKLQPFGGNALTARLSYDSDLLGKSTVLFCLMYAATARGAAQNWLPS